MSALPDSGAGAPIVTSVEDQCRRLRLGPARARAAVALSLARLVSLDGAHRLGWSSQRDYARARLGLPWGRYSALLRVGRTLGAVPQLIAPLLDGELTWTVAESCSAHLSPDQTHQLLPLLSRLTAVDGVALIEACSHAIEPARANPSADRGASASASSTDALGDPEGAGVGGPVPTAATPPEPDPLYEILSVTLPAPVSTYVDETLQLAAALLGHDVPEDQALAAVLAEASTEVSIDVDLGLARRHWAKQRRRGQRRRHSAPSDRPRPQSKPCDCERRATDPDTPSTTPRDPTRAAVVLDRWIRRALNHLRLHDNALEDTLLEVAESNAHVRCGFARLTDFAHVHLDLGARTVYDRLDTARRRRAEDPLAIALAEGRITRVQLHLLARLRKAGVPRSALPAWIDFAEGFTVRALRTAVHWGRARLTQDARAYTLEGCPPPSETQLRTPGRRLEEIAADATPPGALRSGTDVDIALVDLLTLARMPMVHRTWTLESDSADLLYLLSTSIQHRSQSQGHRTPHWWPILKLFHLARRAWQRHYDLPKPRTLEGKAILRDQFTCGAPDCSRRRNLHGHHLHHRARGGAHTLDNLQALCATHHLHGIHGSPVTLRVEDRTESGGPIERIWALGPVDHPEHILHFHGERRLSNPHSRRRHRANDAWSRILGPSMHSN